MSDICQQIKKSQASCLWNERENIVRMSSARKRELDTPRSDFKLDSKIDIYRIVKVRKKANYFAYSS